MLTLYLITNSVLNSKKFLSFFFSWSDNIFHLLTLLYSHNIVDFGLVMPYDNIESLVKHWLRQSLVARWHQDITWTFMFLWLVSTFLLPVTVSYLFSLYEPTYHVFTLWWISYWWHMWTTPKGSSMGNVPGLTPINGEWVNFSQDWPCIMLLIMYLKHNGAFLDIIQAICLQYRKCHHLVWKGIQYFLIKIGQITWYM